MTKPIKLSMPELVEQLKPGMTVFIPGISGESLSFFDALNAKPEQAKGVLFVGAHFPGINRHTYAALHEQSKQRAYFMQPTFRPEFLNGRVELIPVDYPGIVDDLSTLNIDLAIAQVSPLDEKGYASLGICYDFLPTVWDKARLKVLHVNPNMPRTEGSFSISISSVDYLVEAESPLVTLPAEIPNEPLKKLACHVAEQVKDGDTLQLGIGKMVTAVLQALEDHRQIFIHAGMVTDAVLPLIDKGIIKGKRSVTVGAALGEDELYQRVGNDEIFYFMPVSETHDVCRIGKIDNFVAINAAIEVDLFGQINCDSINGKLVAGVGGMPAFTQGAKLSKGGRVIFCLLASAARGEISRIVTRLDSTSLVGATRHVADLVITEYGVADLRGATISERAKWLIAIADPAFRSELQTQWKEQYEAL